MWQQASFRVQIKCVFDLRYQGLNLVHYSYIQGPDIKSHESKMLVKVIQNDTIVYVIYKRCIFFTTYQNYTTRQRERFIYKLQVLHYYMQTYTIIHVYSFCMYVLFHHTKAYILITYAIPNHLDVC